MTASGTIETNDWIIEISVHSFLVIFVIIVKATNKHTGEIVHKIYKTSVADVDETIEKIKNDLGDYK